MTFKNYNSKKPKKGETSEKESINNNTPSFREKGSSFVEEKYNSRKPEKKGTSDKEREELPKCKEYNKAAIFQEEGSSFDEVQTRSSIKSPLYQIQKSMGHSDTVSSQNERGSLIKFQLIDIKQEARFGDEKDKGVIDEWYTKVVYTVDLQAEGSFFFKTFEGPEEAKSEQDSMKDPALQAVSTVDETGGTLQISDTNVKLEIPRGALEGQHEIQIRIIPNVLLVDKYSQSFCSNSSVVVEILPSNLELKHPAKLTLPHCLILNRDEECKADLYSCTHQEDIRPLWRKVSNISPDIDVLEKWCVTPLTCFSKKALKIFNRNATGKNIVVYAARKKSSTDLETVIDIGWYRDIPCENRLLLKKEEVLEEKPFRLTKSGKRPVQVSYEAAKSPSWICMEDENTKYIPYKNFKTSTEFSCPFQLVKRNPTGPGVTCRFTVKQELNTTGVIEFILFIKNPSPSQPDQNSNFQIPQPANPDDCVPVDVLERLSQKISKDWKKVGRKLGLKDEKLDNIERDYHRDQQEQAYRMFKTWFDAGGHRVTYRMLREALIAVGRQELADEMC